MPSIFIALGSNIDPEDNLKAAATMLREEHPAMRFSSVYETKARDREDQPDFLNAVALLQADVPAQEMFEFLRNVELHLGKNPPFPQGPRTIDLDFLLYGDQVIQNPPTLIIPHPRMHERRFVLEPLIELIDPAHLHPALLKPWQELLQQTLQQEAKRMPIAL